jgi:hypothetical protein
MTEARQAGPRVTYDPAVDALAVEIIADGRHARSVRASPNVLLHFDPRGRPVELEIHGASGIYSAAELAQIASPAEWLTLMEAAAATGLATSTLRWQIRKKRLVATKRGHDWFVSRAALGNYLEDRKPSGRMSKTAAPRRRVTKAHA